MTVKPKLLTPRDAAAHYAAHGVTRGRSVSTLQRLRSEGGGPRFIRDDLSGSIFYPLEEVEADLERLTLRPRYETVAQERAAGERVPNTEAAAA